MWYNIYDKIQKKGSVIINKKHLKFLARCIIVIYFIFVTYCCVNMIKINKKIDNIDANINITVQIPKDIITTTEREIELATTTEQPTTTEKKMWIDLTETDYIYLCKMAETETYQGSFEGKCNVVSVAINRYNSGKFGNSVTEVITKPHQFAYGRSNISKETKKAVNYVIKNGDTTNGALFFHSYSRTNTFNGANYIFTDNVGHHFYK